MAIPVTDPATGARRWTENTERAACEAVLAGTKHAEIAWGLACLPGGARSFWRGRAGGLHAEVPPSVCEALKLKAGDRYLPFVTPDGDILLHPVTVGDLAEYLRPLAMRADEILAQQQPRRALKHFENVCDQCGHLFCGRRSNARFCPTCGLLRARASAQRHWARRGKLSPSYQRKLKGRGRTAAESAALPAPRRTDTKAEGALAFG